MLERAEVAMRKHGSLPFLILFSRTVSTIPAFHLSQRMKQTENEIVRMFKVPFPTAEQPLEAAATVAAWRRKSLRRDGGGSAHPLDERFLRILKIFRWGPDAEKALEVLMLRVDRRLVREVIKAPGIAVSVKSQFFRWASKRKGFLHDSTTFMPLIRCFHEAGLVGEMWKTMLEMVRGPCTVNPAELSELVKILGSSKMVNKACSIFYQAKARNKCRPTSQTYNSMIVMLMQEGHNEKVHELYNEMCRDGERCLPDTMTYSSLISAFCKLGRDAAAVRLFEEMKENGLTPVARIYTSLIALFFRSGEVDKAMRFFQEMKERSCNPNVFTYTEVIKGLGEAGKIDDALHFYSEMLRGGCRPDTVLINNLLNLLRKACRIDDVMKLWEEIQKGSMRLVAPPSVVTYNTVIKTLLESNSKSRVADATLLMEKMKEEGIAPSDFTYSILIDGLCKSNRVEKALMLLEEMDEKGFAPCPAAYCSLIDALGRVNRMDLAGELFRELRENSGGRGSSSRIYAVMIKHLGKCGRLNEAKALFDEMRKLGVSPDVFSYNALMSGMVRAGEVDEATSVVREMSEAGCKPDINSYNIILHGVATKAGGPLRAVEMLANMNGSAEEALKPDAVSYNTVLGALSRAGMFEEAARLMKEMNSRGFEYDLITYSSILEAIGKVDVEPDQALR